MHVCKITVHMKTPELKNIQKKKEESLFSVIGKNYILIKQYYKKNSKKFQMAR